MRTGERGRRATPDWRRRLGAGLACTALVTALVASPGLARAEQGEPVVEVGAPQGNFRARCSTQAEVVMVLKQGEQVTVLGRQGAWSRVRHEASGSEGCMHTSLLTEVAAPGVPEAMESAEAVPKRVSITAPLPPVRLQPGAATAVTATPPGRIEGRVRAADGSGLAGVKVTVDEARASTLTDGRGWYALEVPHGRHQVRFLAGQQVARVPGVEVEPLGVTRLDRTLNEQPPLAEAAVVESPTRRRQRMLEAAGTATTISRQEITAQAAHGQVAKLPEFGVGMEVAQSDLHDFQLSGRGFNTAKSRDVALRIDGRDPSMLFLGGQEWASLALPLDTLVEAEALRGPASAVYGPDAAGGVLSLVTREPQAAPDATLRLVGGEHATAGADVAVSTPLGGDFYLGLTGYHRQGEDFAASRTSEVEYSFPCTQAGQTDCLPLEAAALDPDEESEVTSGSLRLDRRFLHGGQALVEVGASESQGTVMLTDLGRVRVDDGSWLWGRLRYAFGLAWELTGGYKRREADRQTVLATGANVELDEEAWSVELRTTRDLTPRLSWTAGLRHENRDVATSEIPDPDRASPRTFFSPFSREGSLLLEPVRDQADAVYAGLDWRPVEGLTLSVDARYDDSRFLESQYSPRASVVYAPTPSQSLRLVLARGFRAPTYAERFLQLDLATPLNLAVIEPMCNIHGVTCGFDADFSSATDAPDDTTPDTRLLAVGNPDLDVERTDTLELGYRVSPGHRLLVDVGYHYSQHQDRIVGLLPQLGTGAGRLNPAFGAYDLPAPIPARDPDLPDRSEILPAIEALLGDLFPFLSTNIDGTPILVLSSYANLGEVTTQGVDLHVEGRIGDGWSLRFAYTWLDAEIDESPPGLESFLLPSSPEHRASVTAGYAGSRFDARLGYRWVDAFRWVSGPFRGGVPSYGSADLSAGVHLGRHVSLGLQVSNLLDEEHWETFGGAVLGRRALGQLVLNW